VAVAVVVVAPVDKFVANTLNHVAPSAVPSNVTVIEVIVPVICAVRLGAVFGTFHVAQLPVVQTVIPLDTALID
jgi:hypothetical protein